MAWRQSSSCLLDRDENGLTLNDYKKIINQSCETPKIPNILQYLRFKKKVNIKKSENIGNRAVRGGPFLK